MQTRTWRDRGIAWCVVLAWHLLAGWWLLHALPEAHRGTSDDALRVVYVSVPLPSPAPPSPVPPPLHVHDIRTPTHPDAAKRALPQQSTLATIAGGPDVPSPPSPPLLDQARRLVRQHADDAMAFTNDPLADRPAHIPAADVGRFRMRAEITPASAIAWIGKHVTAPAGYEQDPCPRNKHNIAGLLAQGDSSRLQMELEYERRHCRP